MTDREHAFDRAPLRPVPGCAALVAHQADDPFAVWGALESGGAPVDVPFWCLVWPAARVLAAFVLSDPARVAGRTVLELACGAALPAIASARAGAGAVFGLDLDPLCIEAARRNARANDCSIALACADVVRESWPSADLILVADFFYERGTAARVLARLGEASRAGAEIWIADAGRPFAPRSHGEMLADETVPVLRAVEGSTSRRVRLERFGPGMLEATPGPRA